MHFSSALLMILGISVAAPVSAEPLIATYEVTISKNGHAATARFTFARDSQTVAFIDSRKSYRDIWDLASANQQLRLRRVVDLKRSSIEFLPSELVLRGHVPKWENLQTPFGADVLRNCEGQVTHVVECLPGDALPSKVVMRFGQTEVTWFQTALSRDKEAFSAAVSFAEDYALWDAADFGDQEYDRDLQALLPYADLDPHNPRIHSSNERRAAQQHRHDGHVH